MQVDITKRGIELTGLTRARAGAVIAAFGGRVDKARNSLVLPPRSVFALLGYYAAEVRPTARLRAWLDLQRHPRTVAARASQFLRDWQRAEIVALARDGHRGTFADAGAGKTVLPFEAARLFGRTLVVAEPLLVSDAYVEDHRRWYPNLTMVDTTGLDAQARKAAIRRRGDVFLVSPNVIGGLLPELRDAPWAVVCVDESAKMRNRQTQLSRALHSLAPAVPFRAVMSALPDPSSVADLWSQVAFLDGSTPPAGEAGIESDSLGSWGDFVKKYSSDRMQWPPYHRFESPTKNAAALDAIKPICSWVPTSEFWPTPPPQRWKVVPVPLERDQQRAYDEMAEHYRLRLATTGEDVTAPGVAERQMKLREICAGFIYDRDGKVQQIGRSKLRVMAEVLRQIGRESIVIWCQFIEEYNAVGRALAHWQVPHGVLAGNDRESRATLRDFKAGKLRVLVSHPKTASHGLRWPHCRNMIFLSPDWDRELFVQAIKRIHRPPQQRECRFWVLISPGTIEEDIWARLRSKAANARRDADTAAAMPARPPATGKGVA